MEINGTIYRILQTQEVIFNDGTKKVKGGFVIMRDVDYPKPVAIELFGEERLSMLNGLNLGMPVRVSFHAESQKSKDYKFYTTLLCTILLIRAPVRPRDEKTPLPETDELKMPISQNNEVPF
jgi:hypothetical protein